MMYSPTFDVLGRSTGFGLAVLAGYLAVACAGDPSSSRTAAQSGSSHVGAGGATSATGGRATSASSRALASTSTAEGGTSADSTDDVAMGGQDTERRHTSTRTSSGGATTTTARSASSAGGHAGRGGTSEAATTGGTADRSATGGVRSGGTTAGGNASSAAAGGTRTGSSVAAGGRLASSGGTAPIGEDTGCAGSSFQLLWQDDFDRLDTARWQFMTHTLGEAQFTAENADVSGGMARLALSDAPAGSALPYRGVEMRSRETLTYGKVESRIRFASGSGVISSLVLIYTPWPPPDWNEIDIEFFGKGTDRVQFNTMINVPPADPLNGHSEYPKVVTLDFDATAEFHTYSIEWVPNSVRFYVDGNLMHTATQEMSRMVLPQNILLTIWASDAATWAGPLNAASAPATVQYDWVRVCRFVG